MFILKSCNPRLFIGLATWVVSYFTMLDKNIIVIHLRLSFTLWLKSYGGASTKCFTGNYITRKIHMKLHPGLEWRIFHVLTSKDIDDFTDIKFVSLIVLKFVGV